MCSRGPFTGLFTGLVGTAAAAAAAAAALPPETPPRLCGCCGGCARASELPAAAAAAAVVGGGEAVPTAPRAKGTGSPANARGSVAGDAGVVEARQWLGAGETAEGCTGRLARREDPACCSTSTTALMSSTYGSSTCQSSRACSHTNCVVAATASSVIGCPRSRSATAATTCAGERNSHRPSVASTRSASSGPRTLSTTSASAITPTAAPFVSPSERVIESPGATCADDHTRSGPTSPSSPSLIAATTPPLASTRMRSASSSGVCAVVSSTATSVPSGRTLPTTARASPSHAVWHTRWLICGSTARRHVTAVAPDCEQSSAAVHARCCSRWATISASRASACRPSSVCTSLGSCAAACCATRWPCTPWPSKTPKSAELPYSLGKEAKHASWLILQLPSMALPGWATDAHTTRAATPLGVHVPCFTSRCGTPSAFVLLLLPSRAV